MVIITFAVHIPLNDDLKAEGDPARIENIAEVRDDFVTPSVAWDIVRTLVNDGGLRLPHLGARPARTHGASGAATTDLARGEPLLEAGAGELGARVG